MNICMVGCGYVGLVSGACFSDFGWNVTCIDTDSTRIKNLNAGIMPIYEPGLGVLIARNRERERLSFTTELESAISQADVVFLAVGTPMLLGDGHADLSFVYRAIENIAPHLTGFTVVVTKSTVPVGTSRKIEHLLQQVNPNADIAVCSNPEFLREGSAIHDFTHPDRVLVGSNDARANAIMMRLYEPLALRQSPVIFVGRESAELAKYAANSFLAMKISFINEVADLCEATDADVREVANAIGSDGRIGSKFLDPGPGYGGSCFPKDITALMVIGRQHSSPITLIEQVAQVNANRKVNMARRIVQALGGDVSSSVIGILGVTFKPNTDDMRDAPSLDIIPALQRAGAIIKAYDPHGMERAKKLLENVVWCDNALDVANGAHGIVVLTEWDEFCSLNLKDIAQRMSGHTVIDLRNMLNAQNIIDAGLDSHGIGRKPLTLNRPKIANTTIK